MKDKKLSLDELIELAKKFDKMGKWRLEDNDRESEKFYTEKVKGIYMTLSAYGMYERNCGDRYWLDLFSVSAKNRSDVEIAQYQVGGSKAFFSSYANREENYKEYEKVMQLHSLIRKRAYAIAAKEYRKQLREKSVEERAEEYQKNRAVDAARKLIN